MVDVRVLFWSITNKIYWEKILPITLLIMKISLPFYVMLILHLVISSLISTHAPNCTIIIPSTVNATYNSIHHIDIGQQTAWTLDLLLHLNTTQPSSSSLSTAANAPWYKSSSTLSSKFSDSWKYYYFKKYSSSTQCPSSLLWSHCTDQPATKAPSLIDEECTNMNIEQFVLKWRRYIEHNKKHNMNYRTGNWQ